MIHVCTKLITDDLVVPVLMRSELILLPKLTYYNPCYIGYFFDKLLYRIFDMLVICQISDLFICWSCWEITKERK